MNQLSPDNPLYIRVLRDFKRWAKDQTFIHTPGMVGQSESHFPCKSAYAVAVFDHDQERFTSIRVMMGCDEWRGIKLN